jgi:hypothetical protein
VSRRRRGGKTHPHGQKKNLFQSGGRSRNVNARCAWYRMWHLSGVILYFQGITRYVTELHRVTQSTLLYIVSAGRKGVFFLLSCNQFGPGPRHNNSVVLRLMTTSFVASSSFVDNLQPSLHS